MSARGLVLGALGFVASLAHAGAVPQAAAHAVDTQDPSDNVVYFEELLLGVSVAIPDISISVSGNDAAKTKFRANIEGSVSLLASYKGWGFSLGARTGDPENDPDDFGKTQYLDLQFHHYNKHFGVDLNWQRYRGFYLDELPEGCERGASCSLRPGLRAHSAGISGYLVLDERYSLPAAFTRDARQLQSAGSWLVMAAYSRVGFQNNGALLPIGVRSELGQAGWIESGDFDTLTISGGYGYSYINGRLFAGGMLLAGAGAQYRRYELDLDGIDTKQGFAGAGRITLRFALGYAGDSHHTGLTAFADGPISYIDDLELQVLTQYVELYYAYRFK